MYGKENENIFLQTYLISDHASFLWTELMSWVIPRFGTNKQSIFSSGRTIVKPNGLREEVKGKQIYLTFLFFLMGAGNFSQSYPWKQVVLPPHFTDVSFLL